MLLRQLDLIEASYAILVELRKKPEDPQIKSKSLSLLLAINEVSKGLQNQKVTKSLNSFKFGYFTLKGF